MLENLRTVMQERGLDGYIITSADAHASEYTAPYWKVREWFSGFTGSNGLVVITQEKAGLWTDARYFIQAAIELEGSGIDLYKMGEENVKNFEDFLAEEMPENGRLGFDGRTLSAATFDKIKTALRSKKMTYAYKEDLVGKMWKDRPPMPKSTAFIHEYSFTGLDSAAKLVLVREEMKKHEIDSYLVVALDDIAWLMNIRGRDIPHMPVVYAYMYITEKDAHVFINKEKINHIKEHLTDFTIHDYDTLPAFLTKIKVRKNILYNINKTNVLLAEILGTVSKSIKELDIIGSLKSIKNETELGHIKNAYIRESAVLVRFLVWLEKNIDKGLYESDIVNILAKLRKNEENYLDDGFATIAAYGKNAASAHYNSGEKGVLIEKKGFLLVDTGGQYLDGTTDTTRTIVVGELTDEMKRDFTLVLKGHINLTRAIYMADTSSNALDILARMPMWSYGINFRHGTGHGIGYCLSVHEGPQGISTKPSTVKIVPGMLLSNEPAIYKEGKYGIRTENVMLAVERFTTEDGKFYGFENLTFVPYDTKAIDISLLNTEELQFINEYHTKTREILKPFLTEEENEWLRANTKSYVINEV